MSDDDRTARARQRRIETARELEARGHVDHAVAQYRKAGAPEEAARLLAKAGRLSDAAAAILESLSFDAADVASLDASDRELVGQAAIYLEAAAEPARAAGLRAALAAAPPPPSGASTRRAVASPSSVPPRTVSESGSSPRPARASPAPSASSSSAPVSAAGSVRAPGSGSGSFRTPSASGPPISFRPPSASAGPSASESFRPRAPSSAPPTSEPTPASFRRPRPSEAMRDALRPGSEPVPPVVVAGAPAVPSRVEVPSITDSGRFRAPLRTSEREDSVAAPPRDRQGSAPAPTLSASGEVITDYASNRASGWRDADDDALERSIQDHLASGRKGAAARVARDAGQIGRALAWFEELGLHAQAGACLRQLGRPAEALASLLRAEPGGPTYRKACFDVIAVATELGALGYEADRFLTGFIGDGPADPDEITAYLDLARLYTAGGFTSGAKRCLRRVLELAPDHADARALEGKLARERRARHSPGPQLTGGSASVRGLPPLPTLEEFVALAREHAPKA